MGIRRVGQLIEAAHTPVYFAPEALEAYAELGLRGFWRGYFASRASSLGPASAETVTELFGGFAPEMVARSIPEVWSIAEPAVVAETRQVAATAALRRLLGPGPQWKFQIERAIVPLQDVVRALDVSESPMAAAERSRPAPHDALGALWHACTVLREYRGDAHLAVLAEHGLGWPLPHIIYGSIGRLDAKQREYRGWSEQSWSHAVQYATTHDVFGTPAAAVMVEEIDAEVDALVAPAFEVVDVDELEHLLTPLAERFVRDLPFPNAMGLVNPV